VAYSGFFSEKPENRQELIQKSNHLPDQLELLLDTIL